MSERAHPCDPGFEVGSPYHKQLIDRYAFANQYINDEDVVLDVPCGAGWGTSLLKGERIYGMDINAEAIQFAINHWGNSNIIFYTGDMSEGLKLSRLSVDRIVCLDGVEHISTQQAKFFLYLAHRVLKAGGQLLLSTPCIDDGEDSTENPYHVHEYGARELFDLLESNGFSVEDYAIRPGAERAILYVVANKVEPCDAAC